MAAWRLNSTPVITCYQPFILELDRLHNYPIVSMSIVSIVRTADVRPIVNVTDCLLKCLVYIGGGKEGQFIKVN